MIIAQISDTHISVQGSDMDQLYNTANHLTRAVGHLNGHPNRPDAVLVTGDLVDSGKLKEYERFRNICDQLKMPYYLIPGNHDDRANMRRAFPDHDYLGEQGFIQYSLDEWPVRVLMLDTNIPGEPGGELCAERLGWLEQQLHDQPHKPTMVCLHHPPFRTGMVKMDNMGLADKQNFGEIIGRFNNIERVLCGHLHRLIQKKFYGTVAMICPSTAHQITLELEDEARLATLMEPPTCLFHYWTEAEGLVTHTSFINDYPLAWELLPAAGDP